jgi:lipoate-protein ligase B
MAYAHARDLQRRLAFARAAGRVPDTLILLQHPHTYTFGRSSHAEHLVMSEAELAARGVAVFEVDRGGDVTYHGPGQLVGYPILYLGRPQTKGNLSRIDYVGYLRQLEEVLIRALAAWDITARRLKGYTGVWVGKREPEKVAAIGVKVDGQGVSQHGFALNVAPDLSYFDGIVPCGIHDRSVTSLRRLVGESVDLEEVAAVVATEFGRVFGIDWRRASLEELGTVLPVS